MGWGAENVAYSHTFSRAGNVTRSRRRTVNHTRSPPVRRGSEPCLGTGTHAVSPVSIRQALLRYAVLVSSRTTDTDGREEQRKAPCASWARHVLTYPTNHPISFRKKRLIIQSTYPHYAPCTSIGTRELSTKSGLPSLMKTDAACRLQS